MRLDDGAAPLRCFFQQERAVTGTDAGRDAAINQKLRLISVCHRAEQQDRAINARIAHSGGFLWAGGGKQSNPIVNKLARKLHSAQPIAVCLDRSDNGNAPPFLF